ncbi:anthranilate phosphoribosyltransferase [Neolewinella lacunae]|uniref:Anthranilate phosphoribosyltransferase n=1 Tax=Neolewinella lacunae TaxID=1517758 RepID=A0A923PI29_9BACT|nr:anthranilate phosphoribosyltransferase [Neolewinella lacunae]MBC6994485.1 anthranilate phosphoribosyltransferase [Neolewinella lacunae]MDN3634178.1 anthranilate phosphoribosyltransferase [Neolewinella lacunae]
MKNQLHQLYAQEPLSRDAAYETLSRIGNGRATDIEIAAVVSAVNMRPAVLSEIQGFRDAMLELAHPIDLGGRETIDIVGTGGDGKNTFNISTLASVVVAGAGYPVTKHGSYGVSSNVGSSDVLQALGYTFTNDQDTLLRTLDRTGICFFHAPLFHPAMKNVVPIRKSLGVRTFFNLLGPLLNPARPKYQVFGTYDRQVARIYDYLLQDETGREFSIVHALDGYDEISLTGAASVRSRERQRLLHPQDFGLPALTTEDLHGGETAEDGKAIFLAVLNNAATPAQRDVVCANAGLAIHTIHPDRSLPDCVAEAAESLSSGRALGVLNRLIN